MNCSKDKGFSQSKLPQDVKEFIAAFGFTLQLAPAPELTPAHLLHAEDVEAWMSGHVRVPVEVTEAMLVAARDWSLQKYGIPIGNDAARGCWEAMLSAAKEEP